ncbi:glycosyl transferase [Enterovibrio norvegicus FF-162]|uniref:Glycosyl transferase n=1 Tax=Enterovibrio norvegicus FF-454 TaxID=1185651 RepID=A0A1E5BXW8_9GAMM|nr:glycosyltransferase [Enterovibrio norvegicus]OEE58093.1 glycosyl transferase [Enterovibrio norvegicus FF-454]OEE76730.1 glycosyl transferase [Enterovibrio norvegicus FF-162]
MDKVSVITPSHNCLPFLPKAMESVLNQTHKNLELLIINDNSSDDTEEYLTTITDSRIRVFHTAVGSAAKARNIGLRHAKGDYIAFLDADDYWYPDKLALQLNLHKLHPDIALSFTNYEHVDEELQPIVDCFAYWGHYQHASGQAFRIDRALETILINNIIGTSTVILNRHQLAHPIWFDDSLSFGEDWDLWLRICEQHPIGVLSSVQTAYLMRQNSLTQTQNRKLDNLRHIERIFDQYCRKHLHSEVSYQGLTKGKARLLEGYADYYRSRHQYAKAIWLGLNSLRLDMHKRRVRSLLGDCRSVLKIAW